MVASVNGQDLPFAQKHVEMVWDLGHGYVIHQNQEVRLHETVLEVSLKLNIADFLLVKVS